MATPTIDQVRNILPSATKLTDPQIQGSIDSSACVVDGLDSSLTDACLTQVNIYLAAHFAAVTESQIAMKSEKGVHGNSAVYGFEVGKGIMGTPFGQVANTVSGGLLAELDKQPANMFAIGCT